MNENFNGFRMPAEWEPQNSVWIAWPYNKNDWPGLYQFIPEVILKIIKTKLFSFNVEKKFIEKTSSLTL